MSSENGRGERLFRLIMGHRRLVIALLAVITATLGYFATRIEFDNSIESYFLESDLRDYDRFLDEFGTDEFVVVTVGTAAALRSLTLGALAMIPNLLPILVVLALMPVLDIPLDVGTVMLAGVALGLVVDDTTHFLYRLKEQRREVSDVREAIARAMTLSGRPIVFTSLVLALGFPVLVLASFNPVTNFGILAGMVIVLALIFDLVVLPALVGFLRPSI